MGGGGKEVVGSPNMTLSPTGWLLLNQGGLRQAYRFWNILKNGHRFTFIFQDICLALHCLHRSASSSILIITSK